MEFELFILFCFWCCVNCDVYISAPIHIAPFCDAHHSFFLILLYWVRCVGYTTMEMGRSGNGGGKVVTFDDSVAGRRRNGGSLSSYLDVGNKDAVEAGRAARPMPGMGSRRRTYADGELDVFTAERYFKGAMDGDGGDRKEAIVRAAVAAVVPPVETAAARPAEAVVMARPSSTSASTASFTASSASSVNSQTALFRGGHRRRGRKCCVQVGVLMRTCSGKRSVRVDGDAAKEAHDVGEPPAASRIDWYRELRMQKAALGLVPGDGGNNHGVVAAGLPPVAAIGREMTREEKAAGVTFSSSMRRSVALVAPVVRANALPASGRAGIGDGDGDCDDDGAGSESSSDLFEIKSLMIEDCRYEPSEASIQWSVVTASATDASEPRGDRVPGRWVGGRGPVAGRQHRDHRPVGLLAGCASHRAVDVSAATRAAPNTGATAAAVQRRGDGFQKARNAGA
ncbi:hypothetical protein SETIT_9G259600v2 [Setaria italica]|uniref:Uncharacterized protein n=2 Tax=Setaria italica TaxID=4555 RepID=A0A368SKV1_SETIT|nr:hypothetical protein SETIT_9G259600v2 [Setaria italica]